MTLIKGKSNGAAASSLLRRIVSAALWLLLALVCSCCGTGHRKPNPRKPPLVGFSLDSLVVERWQRDLDTFSGAVKDLGANFIYKVADQDAATQESQVRELVASGIDVLVIVPNDADRLSSVVSEVKARGIPVISYDRLVRKAGVDLYVSFDNEKVGSLMAESIVKAVPSGSFFIINGAKSDNNASLLSAGIHSVLDPRVAEGKISIISEVWPATWDSDEAKARLESLLASDERIDAVIAGNDMFAEAAINVLSESGRMGAVKVSGQDADLSACQRIAEGTQYATIYKPIERLALSAAGYAVMLAKGEKVKIDNTIYDGAGKVPYIKLEPILVTKELLDSTVIKDGFHSRADVYRNVGHR